MEPLDWISDYKYLSCLFAQRNVSLFSSQLLQAKSFLWTRSGRRTGLKMSDKENLFQTFGSLEEKYKETRVSTVL